MINTNIITENENIFLELVRNTDANGIEFILKSLLCAVSCGEEFFNEIKVHVEREDETAIRSVVERYASGLKIGDVKQC